jgi:hypothetical protein
MRGTSRRWKNVRRKLDGAPSSRGWVSVGLLAGALLAACGGGGDGKDSSARAERGSSAPSTATSTTNSTEVAAQDPEVVAAVEAAYREAWTAFIAYNSETGPFNPTDFNQRAGRYFTGVAHDAIFNASQRSRLQGEVFSPPGIQDGELAPKVTVESPSRATVWDCSPHHATVKAATGERVDEPIEGREDSTVVMMLEDGQWRIADIMNTNRPCTV